MVDTTPPHSRRPTDDELLSPVSPLVHCSPFKGISSAGSRILEERAVENRSLSPRDLRKIRRSSLQSEMDIIESGMSLDERKHVALLSKQGAIHYQAEEDFLYAPAMKRSMSAPISSLAERYQRLRSCTSPLLFPGKPDTLPSQASDPNLLCVPSMSPTAPSRTVDMLEGMDFELPILSRSAPCTLKPPMRITVRPAAEGEEEEEQTVPLPSGELVSRVLLDRSVDALVPEPMADDDATAAVPSNVVAAVPDSPPRKKRGSGTDPALYEFKDHDQRDHETNDQSHKRRARFQFFKRQKSNTPSPQPPDHDNDHRPTWRARVHAYFRHWLS
eukprot:m.237877 g.237877  ORF g.237877 m.237877 type:complete len:330 (+) comp13210_c0_seq1:164-1153(+)